ncbi:MAG: DUF503 domain-containing protein [Chloroflexi bacterium]|nr:MAG: DUF503 domain-containing protein [Chloroflexota bacterium]
MPPPRRSPRSRPTSTSPRRSRRPRVEFGPRAVACPTRASRCPAARPRSRPWVHRASRPARPSTSSRADRSYEVVTVSVLLTLHLPGSQSLKDKRAVVRSLVDRIHARLQLSAAEVGSQDLMQRAEVGFAVVSEDRATAHRVAEDARRFIDLELLGKAEVISTDIDELELEAEY